MTASAKGLQIRLTRDGSDRFAAVRPQAQMSQMGRFRVYPNVGCAAGQPERQLCGHPTGSAWASTRPIAVLHVARFGARQQLTSATTTPPGEDTINVGALLARGSSCKPAALNAVSGVIFGVAIRGDDLDDKELTCATRTISLKAWRSMRRGG